MDASSVSLWDYVNLVGHYNKLIYQDSIDPRLLERGYTEDQIRQLQQQQKRSTNYDIISCNIRLTGDLSRWDYPYFNFCMSMFEHYRSHGTMPYPGSYSEQPAKIIEIFNILEQLTQEREEMIKKQQEKESRRRGNNGRR